MRLCRHTLTPALRRLHAGGCRDGYDTFTSVWYIDLTGFYFRCNAFVDMPLLIVLQERSYTVSGYALKICDA
jgi:hypothetical protein